MMETTETARAATAAGAGGLTMILDRRYEHARVLCLRGVLTSDTAEAARGAVIEQLALVPAILVLDLSGLTFVDRCGAESLWRMAERAETADISLRLVAAGAAWTHLATVGVRELGPVYATVEEALRRTQRPTASAPEAEPGSTPPVGAARHQSQG